VKDHDAKPKALEEHPGHVEVGFRRMTFEFTKIATSRATRTMHVLDLESFTR
jgi:hypothetical protein